MLVSLKLNEMFLRYFDLENFIFDNKKNNFRRDLNDVYIFGYFDPKKIF